MRLEQFDHPQVPFVTAGGAFTSVDKGLLHILNELKRLGVETQYSCENMAHCDTAYVLADRRSFGRVLRKIYKDYRFGRLSHNQRRLVRDFLKGYRAYDFSIHKNGPDGIHEVWRYIRGLGSKHYPCFCIEQVYSNIYGFRTTIRWPIERTADVLELLRSLK